MDEHTRFMERALQLARQAERLDEVPVGAVLVVDGKIVGEGHNQPIAACDPTAHAEIVALRAAAVSGGNYRLPGSTLYVTIEPCTMCVGAMIHARIERVVFGCSEPRAGALQSRLKLGDATFYNHRISWQSGVMQDECAALISNYFSRKRRNS